MRLRFLLLVTLLCLAVPLFGQTYSVTDLGTLGSNSSQAIAVNNNGQVVGNSATSGGFNHCFIWQSGTMTDMTPSAGSSSACGINASGQVALSKSVTGGNHACIYYAGTLTDITPSGNWGAAMAINDAGTVVGNGYDSTGNFPFIYTGGTFGNLGSGYSMDFPASINNDGVVAGYNQSTKEVFLYKGGTRTVLETMGTYSWAAIYGMNVLGEVSYYRSIGISGVNHYYRWKPSIPSDTTGALEEYTSLLPSSPTATPFGINCWGDIVGDNGGGSAFVLKYMTVTDLNTATSGSGWTISEARGINDRGQIACTGHKVVGGVTVYHGLLLTPL